MENKVTDEKYLKFLCQKMAYVCFVRDDRLKQNGIKHENIKSFEVKLFVDGYHNDDQSVDYELKMRFVVNTNVSAVPEVCFMWSNPTIMNAVAEKAIAMQELSQTYTFKYEIPPNPLELFDAEFLLEQELGVLIE